MMRLEAIAREAWRNVISGTSQSATLATILTIASCVALGTDIVAVSRLVDDANAFRDSGGSIMTIEAPGRIDGARCENLMWVDGVRAAGAVSLSRQQRMTPSALPGAPMMAADVTPGFLDVLAADVDGGPGVVLPREVTSVLGLSLGDPFVASEGTARIAGTYEYPNDGRRNGYGYLALNARSVNSVFDECWADTWPQNQDIRSLLLLTVLPGGDSDEPPSISQLNSSLGSTFLGNLHYRDRITRLNGVIIAAGTLVVAFVAIRVRRVELATTLHDRIRKRDLWAMLLIELTSWIVPPVILCMTISSLFFSRINEGYVGAVIGMRVSLSMLFGALLGVSFALVVTRERDLIRYAKER
jgi:hypothetical protein